MNETCWKIWPDRGFLPKPDPLCSLSEVSDIERYMTRDDADTLEHLARGLPTCVENRRFRKQVNDELPLLNFVALTQKEWAESVLERIILLYSYFANAYVFEDPAASSKFLPAQISRPLYHFTKLVGRQPVLSYPSYILFNWRRVDPAGAFEVENLQLLQEMRGGMDEAWFVLIHVEIEAIAASIMKGIRDGVRARRENNEEKLLSAFEAIASGLKRMTRTLRRMPEGCDPNTYYHIVRPYIDGYNEIVFDGVDEFGMEPKSFRGQAAAQSSIVPSIVSFLGIMHESNSLTQHLKVMRTYMPTDHRDFIDWAGRNSIRSHVESGQAGEAGKRRYNCCIESLAAFRRLHLKTVKRYIFDQSGDKDQLGTGGTVYLRWLRQLSDETQNHLIS